LLTASSPLFNGAHHTCRLVSGATMTEPVRKLCCSMNLTEHYDSTRQGQAARPKDSRYDWSVLELCKLPLPPPRCNESTIFWKIESSKLSDNRPRNGWAGCKAGDHF